jgi:diacylglycerol kinase
MAGFSAAWKNETAFRQEALIAIVLIPIAFWAWARRHSNRVANTLCVGCPNHRTIKLWDGSRN